jgi:hypothetical protein
MKKSLAFARLFFTPSLFDFTRYLISLPYSITLSTMPYFTDSVADMK